MNVLIFSARLGYSCLASETDKGDSAMADTIQRVQYFYIEVADKPGKGAQVLRMLQDAGVNLFAFSGFPKGRRAQIDFIPADPVAFKMVAKKAKLKLLVPKTGFLVQGEDRIGAVTEIMAKLADAKINVTACDAVTAGEGRYGAILWVKPRDVQKTAKVLGVW